MVLLLLQGSGLLLTLKTRDLAEGMALLRRFDQSPQLKALTVKIMMFISCYVCQQLLCAG